MRGLNAYCRFDAADWWSNPAQAPLLQRNLGLVDSWSGYAASVAGVDPAWLVFPAVTASGHTNLSVAAGTVSCWFSPYWTSQALGGCGPGRPATLLEVGAWSSLSAVGWWSLQVAPDGNSLAFVAMDGVERTEIAGQYDRLRDRAALGPITAEEEEASLKVLAGALEAAARAAEAGESMVLESMSCPELTALIERIDSQSLRLSACGRKEGVTCDWWSTPNLPSPPSWLAWTWLAAMGPQANEVVVGISSNAKRF